mmetsp:Transcript_1560/g.4020  ORF Transcript_1560/g.4020 Transcript_1560/m.4020 type:complete len:228 (+) Transcript_1560:981-1664(+)
MQKEIGCLPETTCWQLCSVRAVHAGFVPTAPAKQPSFNWLELHALAPRTILAQPEATNTDTSRNTNAYRDFQIRMFRPHGQLREGHMAVLLSTSLRPRLINSPWIGIHPFHQMRVGRFKLGVGVVSCDICVEVLEELPQSLELWALLGTELDPASTVVLIPWVNILLQMCGIPLVAPQPILARLKCLAIVVLLGIIYVFQDYRIDLSCGRSRWTRPFVLSCCICRAS